jgi:hypothetical protein
MKRVISIFTGMLLIFFYSIALAGAPRITTTGKYIIDLGSFPANTTQQTVFEIVNSGDSELIIKNVRKTCGCSKTELSSNRIASGGKATLTVYINANSISGPFSKDVYVENNDPKQRFLRLTVSGKAVPLLKIQPKQYLYMGTLTPGNKYEYKFQLEASRDNVKLELAEHQTNFPVKAELKAVKPKVFVLTVSAEPDKPASRLSAEFEIKIKAPDGWDPLKIKLQGSSRGKQESVSHI